MIKWILQDVKRTLKTRKSFLLFAVIIISIVSFLVQNFNRYQAPVQDNMMGQVPNEATMIENTSLIQIYELEGSFDYECTFPYYQEQYGSEEDEPVKSDKDCSDFEKYIKLRETFETADHLDLKEYYELQLFFLDIATDKFINYYDQSNEGMQEALDKKTISISDIKAIKTYIKEEMNLPYESFEILGNEKSTTIFNNQAIALYETYIAYQNMLPRDIKTQITSSFFIANYLNEFFLLLVLVGALLIFDSYFRDYKSGVIKTILSSPKRRFRYVIMKTCSSILSIMIIILAPLLLTALALFAYNGYDSLNYPIYISRTTLNSMDPVLKYSRIISPEKSAEYYSTYKNICSIAPVSKYPIDVTGAALGAGINCDAIPFANIDIIPLSSYIPMVLGYFILIFVFISSINTFFSLIFYNQIASLIALALSIGSSLVLNTVLIGNSILKFIPFTFLSPTDLLMGTVPYTFKNGLITVILWTIVLNIVNYILMKRKDFSY